MGRKSSSQDKDEGALDKAKRKAKEATGAVTDDKEKKLKGWWTQQREGPKRLPEL